MIKRVKPPMAVLVAFRDRAGPVHFRPGPNSSALAAQFRDVQSGFIHGRIASDDSLINAILALATFEAILTPGELLSALLAIPFAYQFEGRLVIEWKRSDGRQDRRFLHPITAAFVLEARDCIPTADVATSQLAQAAAVAFPVSENPLEFLLSCACAWAYEALPGVLLGHLTGLAPFCALPRSALARKESGKALIADMLVDEAESDQVVGMALDHFFNNPAATGGGWAIEELIKACSYSTRESDASNRGNMLTRCWHLGNKIGEADSLSALLVGWAADLIESGTEAKDLIRPGTIQAYVRCIAMPLHIHVAGKDLLEWSEEDYDVCYRKLIDQADAGNRGNTASALSSFHHFMVRFLDAPPLRLRLHADIDEPLPAANVIWPAEKARIRHWIHDAQGDERRDERLIGQFEFAIEACGENRLRANELFKLRMHNIRIYPDLVELEVAPMISDGPTKTKAGRRVIPCRDPMAQAVIRKWHARREAEGALSSDYVFGDPRNPDRIYRLGALYVLLNRATRAVTGAREVSLHTWGHASISFAVEQALLAPGTTDIDPLDRISTLVGHAHSGTTIRHYAHCFEDALRHHIALALRQPVLTSRRAAVLSGVSAVALRQRAHERKLPAQDVYWAAIREHRLPADVRSASTGCVLGEPVSPLTQARAASARFEDVLGALGDISNGMNLATIALRSNRSQDWVTVLDASAQAVFRRLGLGPRRPGLEPFMPLETTESIMSTPRNAFDHSRIDQAKFASLRKALARLDTSSSKAFIAAWERCYSEAFISLEDPHAAGRLFSHLASAGVPGHHLALSIASETSPVPDAKALLFESALQLSFRGAFHVDAALECKCPRRGRPARYLMWSSSPPEKGKCPPSASLSIAGFNTLMLALATFLEMEALAPKGNG